MSINPEVTVKFKWFILLNKEDGSNCVKWINDNHYNVDDVMFGGVEVLEATHDIAYKIYVSDQSIYTHIVTTLKPISIVENY
jgi:hypothetical protein